VVTAAGQPVDLLSLQLDELQAQLVAAGEPAYRAKQVFKWLHGRGILDPLQWSDLPQALRVKLAETCPPPLTLAATLASEDGSLKYAWRTLAGYPVESVLLPGFDYGTAVCLSCHSGCPLACTFCATGTMGMRARLSAGEMLAQLYEAERLSGQSADRAVIMGMGEALLNLDAVRRTVALLNHPDGHAWSPRRITISTVGLVKPLIKLADTFPRINLGLSLHFTTAEKRTQYMAGAESDLTLLAEALYYFRRANGGKITLEYLLLDRINDSERDAKRLIAFANLAGLDRQAELVLDANEHPEPSRQQPLPLHVNIIEYNPLPYVDLRPSTEAQLNRFAAQLADAGVPVSVRHSRGRDVAAACGMLGLQL
jgi:23S rRNA (adenine2503-C2)-methyltransferase